MWLQHCNFDKMAAVKVFWLPDAVTLPDFSLKPQIALLMLEYFFVDIFKLLSKMSKFNHWDTAFYICIFPTFHPP